MTSPWVYPADRSCGDPARRGAQVRPAHSPTSPDGFRWKPRLREEVTERAGDRACLLLPVRGRRSKGSPSLFSVLRSPWPPSLSCGKSACKGHEMLSGLETERLRSSDVLSRAVAVFPRLSHVTAVSPLRCTFAACMQLLESLHAACMFCMQPCCPPIHSHL